MPGALAYPERMRGGWLTEGSREVDEGSNAIGSLGGALTMRGALAGRRAMTARICDEE